MARIALKCACGWNFFVPGSTPGSETPCPSCGDGVAIPGRKPGQGDVKPPGLRVAERQARRRLIGVLVGLVVAIGVVAFVLLSGGGGRREVVEEPGPGGSSPLAGRRPLPANRSSNPADRPVVADPVPLPSPSDLRPAEGPSAGVQIAELRAAIRHQVWMQNVAGITAEVLRLRNHTELYEHMLLRMRDAEARIEQRVALLAEMGERFAVEPHLQPGDRIVGFASRDVAAMRPGDAAALMAQWLSTFRANQPVEQVLALRGAQRIDLYMQFPEETKELLALSREAALAGPGSVPYSPAPLPGSSATPAAPDAAELPPDVLHGIETRFAAIPAGYRQALAGPERERLERLMQSKLGSMDDHAFLRTRILGEALPAFEREAATFRSKAAELEAKVKEPVAVDVVHLKDGRKLEGQIIDETETHVRLKFKLGTVPLNRADIERIVKGAGAGIEFPERYKAAAGNPGEMVKLLEWCTVKNLRMEREFVATLILTMDPLHEGARKSLGLRMPATK